MSKLINLTTEQLDSLRPWLISVWVTGSKSLPWLTETNDRDVVFYVQHNHPSDEVALFKELIKNNKPHNECWILEIVPDRKYLFGYQYHFLQHVYGEIKPEWDIFEPLMMNRTKRYLVNWVKKGLPKEHKLWYHVLTHIYLFKNGDYFLTDEQAKCVQAAHNHKMTDETFNFIMSEISAWEDIKPSPSP